MTRFNDHGQPVGEALTDWGPPPPPPGGELTGRTVTLTPLEPETHAGALFDILGPVPDTLWTYMPFGPFPKVEDLHAALVWLTTPDFVSYVIVVDGTPLGLASYLRMQPSVGVVEIGAIVLSPQLQKTTAATEAIFEMIGHVFDLGYRRVEWKCDDLNAPSRAAAHRFGFTYEGTFRQATHYKGRSRDTAWYSIIDREWPAIRQAFSDWLNPDNFDQDGRQRRGLREIREGN